MSDDLFVQCVKDAVVLWHHLAIEADLTDCAKRLNKPAVIKKYGLELETVKAISANCPYCFYDYLVGNVEDGCSGCPGVLPDGTGFQDIRPIGPPCYSLDSPYLKFEAATGRELVMAVKEMYELTKRVAEFYNVQVDPNSPSL